jgi:hypothetical protein
MAPESELKSLEAQVHVLQLLLGKKNVVCSILLLGRAHG